MMVYDEEDIIELIDLIKSEIDGFSEKERKRYDFLVLLVNDLYDKTHEND